MVILPGILPGLIELITMPIRISIDLGSNAHEYNIVPKQ